MIVIIDYGCGNILSLKRALSEIGVRNEISKSKSAILNADLIILPGVGAFENAISLLKKYDLFETILKFTLEKKKPLIGICLGMQMLFSKSFEMGEHEGLNLISGSVENLTLFSDEKIKVPHINWSKLNFNKDVQLNTNIIEKLDKRSFYFIHSYMANVKDKKYCCFLQVLQYRYSSYCIKRKYLRFSVSSRKKRKKWSLFVTTIYKKIIKEK